MTRSDYRALLRVQGQTWCRAMFADSGYLARLPYACINILWQECRFTA